MCGITVYFNKKGISSKELNNSLNALQTIRHRGPDGEGVVLINTENGTVQVLQTQETPKGIETDLTLENYKENSAHLLIAHRRLSIIDTSINGHQPMCLDNRYWISFNGEIYNYIEIRKELIELGYRFKTESDTEVILAAYEKWQDKAISKMNGMFSFLIYDTVQRTLFVANDRYGVKPLYYYKTDTQFAFLSEVKQIKNYSVALTLNKEVIHNFLQSSYLDYDQSTVFNEVRRFKPATSCTIHLQSNSTEIIPKPYYQLQLKTQAIHLEEAKEKFNFLFNNAINLRLRSDVPLGCSLSGGLDSSSILVRALKILKTKNNTPNFNTFSVIFPGLSGDESKFINLLVNQLDVKAHYVNPLEEFTISDFEKHIYHQDFPIQSTSYYAEWSLARKVNSENITVLLNGQGGDELLAGYHHHFYRYCRQLILSGNILKYLSQAKQFALMKEISINHIHKIVLNDIKLITKFKFGLSGISSSLTNKWSKANTLLELLKLDFTEYMLPTYLRSDDRDFMAFHVETRHPFLDFNLVDFCYSLPDKFKINDGWQKWLLRETMDELPEEIRYRKDKKGYTTPQEVWLKKYNKEFTSYLNYLPANEFKTSSNNAFLNYSLGAWLKLNQLH